MSIMNPAYWEQIGYTDSCDPFCTSEFYFEGDCRQDNDGDIVFGAISQTIYVFCESFSLDLDWSKDCFTFQVMNKLLYSIHEPLLKK